MAGQNMNPALPCWWRTWAGGKWWEEIQHLAHSSGLSRGRWHLLVIISFKKSIFIYFLTHFNFQPFKRLRAGVVLDFWLIAISPNTPLQAFARDNFGLLQISKICLVEASWVFTSCRWIYLDIDDRLTPKKCGWTHFLYVSADWL